MDAVGGLIADRRRIVRRRAPGHVELVAARVRPGHVVEVIDLSYAGALIDTAHRLRPGTHIELQVETRALRVAVRARVVHCAVSRVVADALRYRGGVLFDQIQPALGIARDTSSVPNAVRRSMPAVWGAPDHDRTAPVEVNQRRGFVR